MLAMKRSWRSGHGKFMTALFGSIGRLVQRRPKTLICASLLLSTMLALCLTRVRLENDMVEGLTTEAGRAMQERRAYMKFIGRGFYASHVLFMARDGGSILRPQHFDRAVEIYRFLLFNHSIGDQDEFRLYHACYETQLCKSELTDGLQFLDLFSMMLRSSQDVTSLGLSFPTTTRQGRRFQVTPPFGGLEFEEANATRGRIRSVRLFRPSFTIVFDANSTTSEAKLAQWELSVMAWRKQLSDPLLIVYIDGKDIGNNEMTKAGLDLLPLFAGGFFAMNLFVLLSLLAGQLYYGSSLANINWWRLVALALATVISPCLASICGLGLFAVLGLRMNGITFITPFLVLGIGVDDAFLLQQAAQRKRVKCSETNIDQENDNKEEDEDGEEEERKLDLSMVVTETGPSIMITSLTNCLAFIIGAVTSVQVDLQLFCWATAICMAFDLLFQFTIFASMLTLLSPISQRAVKQALVTSDNFCCRLKRKSVSLLKAYCQFVGDKMILQAGVLVVLLGVHATSLFTVVIHMRPTHPLLRVVMPNSLMADSQEIMIKLLSRQTMNEIYIVGNTSFLTEKTGRRDFFDLVQRIENGAGMLGEEATMLWLRDYDTFTSDKSPGMEPYLNDLQNFLKVWQYKHWNKDLRFNANGSLAAFKFTVGTTGFQDWTNQTRRHVAKRALCDSSEGRRFGLAVFDWRAPIYDILLAIVRSLVTAVLATVLVMAICCFVFVFNITAVLLATLSIFSVCFGVISSLAWHRLDLDAMMLVLVIMSIGFSVDYTAHVSFHYFKFRMEEETDHKTGEQTIALQAEQEAKVPADDELSTSARRVMATLTAVGWPMVQAGLSTIICVLPLYFSTEATRSFMRAVLATVLIGIVHGLLILPAVFSLVTKLLSVCSRR